MNISLHVCKALLCGDTRIKSIYLGSNVYFAFLHYSYESIKSISYLRNTMLRKMGVDILRIIRDLRIKMIIWTDKIQPSQMTKIVFFYIIKKSFIKIRLGVPYKHWIKIFLMMIFFVHIIQMRTLKMARILLFFNVLFL